MKRCPFMPLVLVIVFVVVALLVRSGRQPPTPTNCRLCGHEWQYHDHELPDGGRRGCVHLMGASGEWCGCGMKE